MSSDAITNGTETSKPIQILQISLPTTTLISKEFTSNSTTYQVLKEWDCNFIQIFAVKYSYSFDYSSNYSGGSGFAFVGMASANISDTSTVVKKTLFKSSTKASSYSATNEWCTNSNCMNDNAVCFCAYSSYKSDIVTLTNAQISCTIYYF